MKPATYSVDMKSPAESIIPVGASCGQPFSPPSFPPAVPGDLSDPKEERMDQASAAPDLVAADCAWNYASFRTLDFSGIPTVPALQRFHAWRFGNRFGLHRY